MFPRLTVHGRRSPAVIRLAVLMCAVPASVITCALTWPAPARASAVTMRHHPRADGNGWADDDTINARVTDGIPRTTDARCTWSVVTGVDPVAGTTERPVTKIGRAHV